MEKQLQPKLRFPEFEGDWEENKIKNVFSIFNGYAFKSEDSVENGVRWIKIADVGINKISNDNLNYLPFEFKIKYKKFILHKGDYVVALTRPILGNKLKISSIDEKSDGALLNQRVGKILSNNNLDFIYNFLQKFEIISTINNNIAGTDPPNLSPSEINNIKFNLPQLPEQQKIADYLSTIDKKITLLEEKKEELARYKKAMMQKLFSQEIRFKDDNGNDFADWEAFQLKDILIEHKEKNKGDKYDEVLSVAKMKGVINQIEHLGRSYSAEKIDHYKVINPFDIVYTKSPTSGFPFGIIKQNKLNRSGVLSPLYAVFKPKTIYIGMILHDIFLSEVETYNYLVPLVQKGAKNTMNINNDEFLKGKKYSLPTSEKEQQKIADFLSAIDESIDKVSEQIKETQSFKKAMLQQMFV